jgi:hypothetical protein
VSFVRWGYDSETGLTLEEQSRFAVIAGSMSASVAKQAKRQAGGNLPPRRALADDESPSDRPFLAIFAMFYTLTGRFEGL